MLGRNLHADADGPLRWRRHRPSSFCRLASSSGVGAAVDEPPRPNPEPPAAGVDAPAASAAFSAARLAGLPDFEPFFFCWPPFDPPPNFWPGMGPMPGIW